jgi:hypothetical protein
VIISVGGRERPIINSQNEPRGSVGSPATELKSTSNTMSRTSALSSRRSKSAWRRRGRGQTPIFSIDGSIDRNNDNVAGGLTRHPGEPQIGQGIAEHAVPAGRQHDGQRNHHKDMRPVVFQVVPIFTSRSRPRARSGGLRIIRPICNGRKRGHCHGHSHCHCHCHCRYHFRCSP